MLKKAQSGASDTKVPLNVEAASCCMMPNDWSATVKSVYRVVNMDKTLTLCPVQTGEYKIGILHLKKMSNEGLTQNGKDKIACEQAAHLKLDAFRFTLRCLTFFQSLCFSSVRDVLLATWSDYNLFKKL